MKEGEAKGALGILVTTPLEGPTTFKKSMFGPLEYLLIKVQ